MGVGSKGITLGNVACDQGRNATMKSEPLGGRLMVRLQTLDLRIGVRVPASQPLIPGWLSLTRLYGWLSLTLALRH